MSVAALGAYSFPLGPLQFTPSSPVGAPPVGPPVLLHSRNVRPPEENESFPLKGEEDLVVVRKIRCKALGRDEMIYSPKNSEGNYIRQRQFEVGFDHHY